MAVFNITSAPYSAIGNDTMDCTAAINAAIAAAVAAGGGEVYVPKGIFKVTGVLAVGGPNVTIRGENHRASLIKQYTPGSATLRIQYPHTAIKALGVKYATIGAAGGYGIHVNMNSGVAWFSITDVRVDMAYRGFYGQVFNSGAMQDFQFWNCKESSVYLETGCHNFLASAGYCGAFPNDDETGVPIGNGMTDLRATFGHIALVGNVQGAQFTNVQTYNGGCSLNITGTPQSRPMFNFFHQCCFDFCSISNTVYNGLLNHFTACEFATRDFANGAASSADGLIIADSDDTHLVNCFVIGATGQGVHLYGSSKNTVLTSNHIHNFKFDGIHVDSGVSDFIFTSNTLGVRGVVGTGGNYGILIAAGASNRFSVRENLIAEYAVLAFADASTGINKVTAPNWG